ILESQLMTSKDKHGQASKGQQALAREVPRPLAELLNRQWTSEYGAQVDNHGGFVFLFIEHIYQQMAMLVYAHLT
ncbi:MAG: hypothetical protein ACJ74G_13585, partial [Blastocatellia bacterium]